MRVGVVKGMVVMVGGATRWLVVSSGIVKVIVCRQVVAPIIVA